MTLIPPHSIKKVLLINLAFIGDVILSTPVTRALKKKYPEASVDMLVIPAPAQIAKGNPYVAKVIIYDKRGEHRNLARLWKLIRYLRAEHYDLAVTTNFSLRSAVMTWLTGATYRAGFDAQHASAFLTHIASSKRTGIQHETENQLEVLKPLGITTPDTKLEFQLQGADITSMQQKVTLPANLPAVVICPFGRHPLKSWTQEGYVELITRLAGTAECYLIGGVGEREQLEAMNQEAGNKAKILAGKLTLGELAALIAKAKAMVTVDTGPMHIASAVGTPVIALFGRTDHRVWGPRNPMDSILRVPLDCWPCHHEECPKAHECMEELQVDQVYEAVLNRVGK